MIAPAGIKKLAGFYADEGPAAMEVAFKQRNSEVNQWQGDRNDGLLLKIRYDQLLTQNDCADESTYDRD